MVSEQDLLEDQENIQAVSDTSSVSSSSSDSSSTKSIKYFSPNSPDRKMAGKKRHDNDLFAIRNSDNTGAIICTTMFNGSNYIGWSSGLRLALEAKSKLGFIDGSLVVPNEADDFDRCRNVDCLVRSWILNTISEEIKTNYSCTTTTRDLWIDIKERMTKLVVQLDSSNKLTQFLMGLNEYYDNARQQILLMDPKPSLNWAFAIIQSIERQKEVQSLMNDQTESFSMSVKDYSERQKRQNSDRYTKGNGGYNKEKNVKEKGSSTLYCTHYKTEGHIQEGCFKLIGYPDWWRGNRVSKAKAFINAANTPFYFGEEQLEIYYPIKLF
ncbi:uncharacterized protein LOC124930179 [Impatiens glandulifera]|uniref:uncharacterized protein LOC124930179 n=1 Tax=Impatiens glandulifera TaxID=253017 RepID=UPI001FB0C377|nr:uncharacterized protein LOC124930179 [Impatiens glandulifera]